ncbi:MAG: hypothetical protein ACLGIT_04895 [Gammaproteobacteria bacterium]
MSASRRMLVVAMGKRVEGLRVAVGLTMADAALQVAVWGALPDDEAATPQLEALEFGDVPVQALPAGDDASWDALARHIVDSDIVYCL